MSKTVPPPTTRPRGRPRKDAEVAPTDQAMAVVIEAFSIHGYNGVSLRTVNDQLGASRNLLYQRFGSKAKLWRAVVDWAFAPMVEHLVAGDDESADPMVRLRMMIRNFIEYSATRPYLARLVMVESATVTDRLQYLYEGYIEPIRSRFVPLFEQLREQGRIKNMPYDVFYFLLTSGGSAPYGQIGLVSLMNPAMASTDEAHVRVYAENVTEIIVNGLSLPS
ncbi:MULTISPECIES: TetR/AcrR family transcriptional regulator [unclassified Streptomyces]|uniref:TetR/AcrR family transcriptional regulator n=1 Tax=unclassified Streptomyces TaxID=2593676 RepID=UPI0034340E1D